MANRFETYEYEVDNVSNRRIEKYYDTFFQPPGFSSDSEEINAAYEISAWIDCGVDDVNEPDPYLRFKNLSKNGSANISKPFDEEWNQGDLLAYDRADGKFKLASNAEDGGNLVNLLVAADTPEGIGIGCVEAGHYYGIAPPFNTSLRYPTSVNKMDFNDIEDPNRNEAVGNGTVIVRTGSNKLGGDGAYLDLPSRQIMTGTFANEQFYSSRQPFSMNASHSLDVGHLCQRHHFTAHIGRNGTEDAPDDRPITNQPWEPGGGSFVTLYRKTTYTNVNENNANSVDFLEEIYRLWIPQIGILSKVRDSGFSRSRVRVRPFAFEITGINGLSDDFVLVYDSDLTATVYNKRLSSDSTPWLDNAEIYPNQPLVNNFSRKSPNEAKWGVRGSGSNKQVIRDDYEEDRIWQQGYHQLSILGAGSDYIIDEITGEETGTKTVLTDYEIFYEWRNEDGDAQEVQLKTGGLTQTFTANVDDYPFLLATVFYYSVEEPLTINNSNYLFAPLTDCKVRLNGTSTDADTGAETSFETVSNLVNNVSSLFNARSYNPMNILPWTTKCVNGFNPTHITTDDFRGVLPNHPLPAGNFTVDGFTTSLNVSDTGTGVFVFYFDSFNEITGGGSGQDRKVPQGLFSQPKVVISYPESSGRAATVTYLRDPGAFNLDKANVPITITVIWEPLVEWQSARFRDVNYSPSGIYKTETYEVEAIPEVETEIKNEDGEDPVTNPPPPKDSGGNEADPQSGEEGNVTVAVSATDENGNSVATDVTANASVDGNFVGVTVTDNNDGTYEVAWSSLPVFFGSGTEQIIINITATPQGNVIGNPESIQLVYDVQPYAVTPPTVTITNVVETEI